MGISSLSLIRNGPAKSRFTSFPSALARRKSNWNTVISSATAKAVNGCGPLSISRGAGPPYWRVIGAKLQRLGELSVSVSDRNMRNGADQKLWESIFRSLRLTGTDTGTGTFPVIPLLFCRHEIIVHLHFRYRCWGGR